MARITGAKGAEVGEREHADVEGFWLDRTEVTVAAYERCIAADVCAPPVYDRNGCDERRDQAGELPVTCVDHVQADTYCWWVGKRLPSYPELVVAALGPKGGLRPVVSLNLTCEDIVVGSVNELACDWKGPAPVGRATGDVTDDGVHDLLGNVMEWTSSQEIHHEAQEIGYSNFGYTYKVELARRPIVRFDWGASSHPSFGFRCARDLDGPRRRPRPKAWLPPPQRTFPLEAPWYRKMKKRGWTSYEEDCEAGCAGFESDPDCVPHCKLADTEMSVHVGCARTEEACLKLHSTCGCAEDDGKCLQDCELRCYDAVGYTDCDDGDEVWADEW